MTDSGDFVADNGAANAAGEPDDLESSQATSIAIDRYWQALNRGDVQAQAEERSLSSPQSVSPGQLKLLELLLESSRSDPPPATPHERRDLSATTSYGAQPPAVLANGTLLSGKLRILSLLDRGGMGEVYVAWHHTLDCEVAVKVLPKHLSTDPESVGRFRKAIQAQARMGAHENIAATMDAGEEQGWLYLVMEYVPGTDLANDVRQHGPVDWPTACRYIRQAALGLRHAHAHGIVHRDIKPSNLILSTSGTIKILDWGLARCETIEASDGSGTRTGVAMGTYDYLAPEQARDASRADARSDLYSLGCTLYFLLTGRAPFAGESSPGAKFAAHESKAPQVVSRLRPEVPTAVDDLVAHLLAKRPQDRYSSASDLIEAIDRLPVARSAASPSRRRAWVLPVVAVVGAVALGWGIWPSGHRTTAKSTAAPATAELDDLGIFFVPQHGDPRYVPLLSGGKLLGVPPNHRMQPGEAFRIEGRFRQPESWWLLWIDTRGKLDPPSTPGKPQQAIGYPLNGTATTINPTDPTGTHLLLLVAARGQPPADASHQLVQSLADVEPTPTIGFHIWHRGQQGEQFRGSGSAVATPQSHVDQLSRRLPSGFDLVAAVFLPWDPVSPVPTETKLQTKNK